MRATLRLSRVVAVSVALLSAVAGAEGARAGEGTLSPGDAEILGPPARRFHVESVTTRVTAFDQYGSGYQSQAGSLLGPGSERTTILEPQLAVVATEGPRLTHRITVPIDIVTAASADALDRHRVDVVSQASRQNTAGTFDWSASYRASPETTVSLRSGLHLEEPFRSWHGGASWSRDMADGDTQISASVLEVFDWFDHFDVVGHRNGRTNRSSTTGSIGLTQILTPTTLVNASYGLTLQRGELGNTWNVVPLTSGKLGDERLPTERLRHALVARVAQFLPWEGALHLYYRLYRDDWGLAAESVEGQLMQRILPALYVVGLYRFHTQSGVGFFSTRASPDASERTADSDLAPLDSHTVGGKVVLDVAAFGEIRSLHFDAGYERYFRTNDLQMNVVTCATGYRF